VSLVRTSYNSFFFVTLDEWKDRKERAKQFQEIKQHLNQELSKLPEGIAFDFFATSDPRRRNCRRIHVRAGDRAGKDVAFLSENLNKFLRLPASARRSPG